MQKKAFSTRPAGIQFGVEDSVPLWQAVLLVMQYVLIVYGSLVIPALVIKESGSSAEEAAQLISLSLMVMGICTMLQASRRFGAGYLCPAVCGAEFAPASIMAVQQGGFSLLAGMLIMTGVFQTLIASVVTRLRSFFPVEVTGVVVFMTGLSLVKYSFTSFLGMANGQLFADNTAMVLAFLSLVMMVVPCVWGSGMIRQNAGLLGLLGGMAAAYLMGYFPNQLQNASSGLSQFMVIPHIAWAGWSWSAEMAIPFLIAGVCSLLGTLGNLTACQKSNTINWYRPDMKILSKGVLVEAISNITGGVLGGAGQGSSAVSVGMSIATGVTSRRIGLAVGACCIALSFFPWIASLYAILPRPVLDASLVMGVSFILLSGIQIISSRMMDIRKTLVVGISIVAGLCVDMIPEVRDGVGAGLRPVLSSPLSVAAIVAVGLNLLFRIGVRQSASIELRYHADVHDEVKNFLSDRGAAWGMRKEVMDRAEHALIHYIEGAVGLNPVQTDYKINANFDEFLLNLEISYQGKPLNLSGRPPDPRTLLESDDGLDQLEGYFVRHYSDRVSEERYGDAVHVKLGFDH